MSDRRVKWKDFARHFYFEWQNWALFVSVPIIGLGVYWAVAIENPSLIKKLAIAGWTELGFALFIAHIIIATVDEREKTNFLEEVKNRTKSIEKDRQLAERRLASRIYLSHALDIELPKRVSDELSEYLVTSRLVKKKQKIVYRLERIGNFVKLEQTFDATFENVDRETFDFMPTFSRYGTEKPNIEKLHPDVPWGLRNADFFRLASKDAAPEKIKQPHHFDADDLTFEKPIEIVPGQLLRQRVSQIVAKYQDDNELFSNKQFSETLSVEFYYERSMFDLNIRVLHPRSDCVSKSELADCDIFDFRYPFLPSHGFVVFWTPRGL